MIGVKSEKKLTTPFEECDFKQCLIDYSTANKNKKINAFFSNPIKLCCECLCMTLNPFNGMIKTKQTTTKKTTQNLSQQKYKQNTNKHVNLNLVQFRRNRLLHF